MNTVRENTSGLKTKEPCIWMYYCIPEEMILFQFVNVTLTNFSNPNKTLFTSGQKSCESYLMKIVLI